MHRMLAVALLMGCAAEAEDDAGCALRVGSYVLTYVEKSGTCGPISQQIIQVDQRKTETTIGPDCTGNVKLSPSNCRTQGTVACDDGKGFRFKQTGTCDFSSDAKSGTCEVQIEMDDPTLGYCSSLYVVTHRRQ